MKNIVDELGQKKVLINRDYDDIEMGWVDLSKLLLKKLKD